MCLDFMGYIKHYRHSENSFFGRMIGSGIWYNKQETIESFGVQTAPLESIFQTTITRLVDKESFMDNDDYAA